MERTEVFKLSAETFISSTQLEIDEVHSGTFKLIKYVAHLS